MAAMAPIIPASKLEGGLASIMAIASLDAGSTPRPRSSPASWTRRAVLVLVRGALGPLSGTRGDQLAVLTQLHTFYC